MKLDEGDLWLIEEVTREMQEQFNITEDEAKKIIDTSNFMRLLEEFPIMMHHDSPNYLAKAFYNQVMNLN